MIQEFHLVSATSFKLFFYYLYLFSYLQRPKVGCPLDLFRIICCRWGKYSDYALYSLNWGRWKRGVYPHSNNDLTTVGGDELAYEMVSWHIISVKNLLPHSCNTMLTLHVLRADSSLSNCACSMGKDTNQGRVLSVPSTFQIRNY